MNALVSIKVYGDITFPYRYSCFYVDYFIEDVPDVLSTENIERLFSEILQKDEDILEQEILCVNIVPDDYLTNSESELMSVGNIYNGEVKVIKEEIIQIKFNDFIGL